MTPFVLFALLGAAPVAETAALEAPVAPQRVYVGTYLTDVSDFDLKAGRFKADLRVWLKWMGGDEPPGITFENGEIESKDELEREHDGAWHAVQYRVQGTFRGDFPVHDFPFDRQTLPVVFGLAEAGTQLVPDLGASGMSSRFSVTGWLYEPYFNARTERRAFSSDLGSIRAEGHATVLPRVAFTVEMTRPIGPYMLKFLLPLSLILLMALLALLLQPDRLDVRSAMGVTSLLSCIAFHYSQADTLPSVSYLVTADLLFLGAYTFVTATLLVSVVSYRVAPTHPAIATRIERFGLVGLPAVTISLLLLLVWSSQPKAPVVAVAAVRPSAAKLKVGVFALDTVNAAGGPQRRSNAVVRGADGASHANLVDEAPSMTNDLVRLLPDGGMRVRWPFLKGLKWSDGSPVTIDDLLFSVNSTVNPLRTSVAVVDERTIDVTYSVRRKEWLEGMQLFQRSALEGVFADGGREAMSRAAVDLGKATAAAYSVKSFEVGKSLLLERNPHFVGPRPVFEEIELVKVAPDDAAKALLEHEVDVLPTLDAVSYAALRKDPRVRVLEQPGDLLYVLMPNVEQAPWNQRDARRALLAAIDREALAGTFKPEPAMAADAWRANAKLPAVPKYDAEAAAAALEGLGLKGQHLQLHVASVKAKDSPLQRLTERLVADLTRAGLEVEVVQHAETGPLVQKRDFSGVLLVSRDAADGLRFLNVPYKGGHYDTEHVHGDYFDAPMREAWERTVASMYDERRAALELAAEHLWAERLPMLPLVLTSRLSGVRADLAGPEWGAAEQLYWNVGDWHFEAPEAPGKQ